MVGRRRKTALAAGMSTLTSLVVFAAPVFACSMVMGPLVMTPTSGPGGTVITTSASGLAPYPAKYAVHFGNTPGDNCMASTGVTILKTITTNRQGKWANKAMVIPASASLGQHEICGVQVYPQAASSGTVHGYFTIT